MEHKLSPRYYYTVRSLCLKSKISDQLVIRLAILSDFQLRRTFSGFSPHCGNYRHAGERRTQLNKRPLKLSPISASSASLRSHLFRINLFHQLHQVFLLCRLPLTLVRINRVILTIVSSLLCWVILKGGTKRPSRAGFKYHCNRSRRTCSRDEFFLPLAFLLLRDY